MHGMAALQLDMFPTIAVPLNGECTVRFGFGRTVYGNRASSAVCGSAGAGRPYLDGKSPVHS